MTRSRAGFYESGFVVLRGESPYGGDPLGVYVLSNNYGPGAYSTPYVTTSGAAAGINVYPVLWAPTEAGGNPAVQSTLPRGDFYGRHSTINHSWIGEHTTDLVRSSTTTAYVAGQLIVAGASALTDASPELAGYDAVDNWYFRNKLIASLSIALDTAAAFDFDLMLFSASPSFAGAADYATFTPTLDDGQLLLGVASFTATDAVGWGANKFLYSAPNLGWLITNTVGTKTQVAVSTQIYVALVTRSAWTPTANGGLNIAVNTMS